MRVAATGNRHRLLHCGVVVQLHENTVRTVFRAAAAIAGPEPLPLTSVATPLILQLDEANPGVDDGRHRRQVRLHQEGRQYAQGEPGQAHHELILQQLRAALLCAKVSIYILLMIVDSCSHEWICLQKGDRTQLTRICQH